MNKRFQLLTLWVLAALALFSTACGAQVVQAEPAEAEPAVAKAAVAKAATYEAMLGESVKDKAVADFIASNCAPSRSLQICRSAGLALWTDTDQIVRAAYLYINNAEGFATYKGELPFGLAPTDTMADVEYKLGQALFQAPQVGWEPGLPDEGYSRDLTYYSAIYKLFDMAVIYNTPAATDKDATIYAIVVGK